MSIDVPRKEPSTNTVEPRPPPRMPKKIGQFHIKSILASGGMGVVYEAVQEHPRRPVALKVMKSGVISRAAQRRFEYESQLLARLRHPGIAHVYEAGMHDDVSGPLHYFAMEYIPNAKLITKYADDKKLGTRERLKLFIPVCNAVHHGHQKGIIHRDLKPGNLLVDAEGQVKIIDFGVARSTDSDMAVTTLQTAVGDLVGTLKYMSPEQCEADPHNIDTRSDVYALGVVLYELLSGRLPYDLTGTPIFETPRVIREVSATHLSTLDKTLRGDVETIVEKALEKDRDRRYQSSLALAQDIERYLNHEPILAHPPSATYRLSKFVRKRRVPLGVVAALLLTLGFAGYSHFKAKRAADAAAMERAHRLSVEESLLNLGARWGWEGRYQDVGNWEVMLTEAKRLTKRWPEVATYWNAKGKALERLGRLREAISSYDEFLKRRPDCALVYVNRAGAYSRLRNAKEAIADCTAAIKVQPDFANAYALRANVMLHLQHKYDAAWRDCTKALELEPRNSLALRTRGLLRLVRGEFEAALQAYNKGMGESGGLPEDFHHRGRLHQIFGDYELALADHDRAAALAPEEARVYVGRGITRRFAGNMEGAIEDLSHAASLNPFEWALQCNQWIWEMRMLRGEPGDREAAEAALTAAQAGAKTALEKKMMDVCRGRAGEREVKAYTTAETDLERCVAFYYLGARALVEGRRDDAKHMFQQCRDTGAHNEHEYDLAGWHLKRLVSD